MRYDGVVGDALLELAKAKELATVLGGAWHANEEDLDSDCEEQPNNKDEDARAKESNGDEENQKTKSKNVENGGGLFTRLVTMPLRRSLSGYHVSDDGLDTSDTPERSSSMKSGLYKSRWRRTSAGVRRPADGKAPGRQDPAAVAKAEAAAKLAAIEAQRVGVDLTWQLPTNVDYYTDRAALLRELVKEMPPEKRLSFQTRVANARTKEAVESLLQDFAPRLECLVLPHARSREVDLLQVKKDTARERVVLDGKEMAFWGSPSDHPHSWHEELWDNVEARVMAGLRRGSSGAHGSRVVKSSNGLGGCNREGRNGLRVGGKSMQGEVREEMAIDNARTLAVEEWNKARAVATTSEVFKAMSRTGAGGDAYFALVALFCTADKMVVPVHCQESPITVEFHQPDSEAEENQRKAPKYYGGSGSQGSSAPWGSWHGPNGPRHTFNKARQVPRSRQGGRGYGNGSTGSGESGSGIGKAEEDVHVVVTVPSTFDIYLRDGAVPPAERHDVGGGRRRDRRHSNGIGDHGGVDASIALHLVRVKAIVEEDIRVVGSHKLVTSSQGRQVRAKNRAERFNAPTPPTLRFLLDNSMDRARNDNSMDRMRMNSSPASTMDYEGRRGLRRAASASPPRASVPMLTLTRTERRMRVALVPEPNVLLELVRQVSRRMGVGVRSPDPPRIPGM